VVSPVQISDWAAPIVPVVKQDDNIWICGNYKLTINTVSKTDPYPLPRIEDIFTSLSGGKSFTELDLTPTSRYFWRMTPSSTWLSTRTRGCSSTTACRLEWRPLLPFVSEQWTASYKVSLMFMFTWTIFLSLVLLRRHTSKP